MNRSASDLLDCILANSGPFSCGLCLCFAVWTHFAWQFFSKWLAAVYLKRTAHFIQHRTRKAVKVKSAASRKLHTNKIAANMKINGT